MLGKNLGNTRTSHIPKQKKRQTQHRHRHKNAVQTIHGWILWIQGSWLFGHPFFCEDSEEYCTDVYATNNLPRKTPEKDSESKNHVVFSVGVLDAC